MTRKKNKEKLERERELKARAAAAAAADRERASRAARKPSTKCRYEERQGKTPLIFVLPGNEGLHVTKVKIPAAQAHRLKICGCYDMDGPDYSIEEIDYTPPLHAMPPRPAAPQEDHFYICLLAMVLLAVGSVALVFAYHQSRRFQFWKGF